MTVSTAYSVLSFAGNGATTAFAVSWPFFTGTLVVTLVSSTGAETVQTITTHYTVSGGTDSNGLPATGTVTMLTAPASGETLRITRATTKTQASTWSENDGFPQKTVEAALDKLTLLAQEGASPGTVNDGVAGDVMELVTSGATDYWDAESQIIRNVADGTATNDAVNYGQLQAFALATGVGDVVGPALAVDGEMVLFDGVTGNLVKRASTTGLLKATSGVLAAAVPGTDYLDPDDLGANVETFLGTPSLTNFNAAITGGPVMAAGVHEWFIPANAFAPRTSNGCAALATLETTTNKVNIPYLAFDATTQEFAQTIVPRMPKSWDEGTITAVPIWTHPSTVTNFGVVWGVSAVALSNDDAADTAFGTAQTSTDTGGTTNDIYHGPATAAVTIGNSPAEGDTVVIQVSRNPSDGSDTLAVDAYLIGLLVRVTTNAANDA